MAQDFLNGVSSYNAKGTSNVNQFSSRNSSASNNFDLGLKDFITLLVAQLQNQDMMNPMKDTEFMAQMAQFSALQAMNNVAEITNTNYAASLVGKEVTVAALNKQGELEKTTGVVTGVSLFDGIPKIFIGDKSYDLNQIMVVGKMPEPEPPVDPETPEEPKPPVDPEPPVDPDTENNQTY